MSKLPFVVQPRLKPIIERLGTEETGIIEIERRGYLTAGEKAFLQQTMSADDVSMKLMALVRKAARDLKVSVNDAHQAIINSMSGQAGGSLENKVAVKYASEIEEITTLAMGTENRRLVAQASCMLMYRVDPDLEIADIMELHPDLLEALAALCLDEESKSTDRLAEQQEDSEKLDPDSFEALEKK